MSKVKALKKVIKAQAKRRKKMEAEKPLSARRDFAKRDVSPNKKTEEKDTLKTLGLAGVTGSGLTVAATTGSKKEAERVKKEQERIKKFQDEKLKSKKKVPVKKAKGGMVTKWESKWG